MIIQYIIDNNNFDQSQDQILVRRFTITTVNELIPDNFLKDSYPKGEHGKLYIRKLLNL